MIQQQDTVRTLNKSRLLKNRSEVYTCIYIYFYFTKGNVPFVTMRQWGLKLVLEPACRGWSCSGFNLRGPAGGLYICSMRFSLKFSVEIQIQCKNVVHCDSECGMADLHFMRSTWSISHKSHCTLHDFFGFAMAVSSIKAHIYVGHWCFINDQMSLKEGAQST